MNARNAVLVFALAATPAIAHANEVIAGTASFGVSHACSPSGVPPTAVGPYFSFWDEHDLTLQSSGTTATWHGWGTVSWNVSLGQVIHIIASGSSKEGFNGAYCGSGLWVYGKGQGDFSITICLDQDYTFTCTATGEVAGIPIGSGTLSAGIRKITGHCEGGGSSFSMDITLTPTGVGSPPDLGWRVVSSVNCPPNGYADPNGPQREQPPLDFDLDGNGVPESWNAKPMLIDGGSCGTAPLVDEAGKELLVVCKPDEDGPSLGADHYEARYRFPGGPPQGYEIGRCGYTPATNIWSVEFEDANVNGIPDDYVKATWTNINTQTGCTRVFISDFTTELTVPTQKSCQDGGPTIADALLVPFGTDLGSLVLNGISLAKPGTQSAGDSQSFEVEAPTFRNWLDRETPTAVPGEPIIAIGRILNATPAPIQFQFDFAAINATLVSQPNMLLVPANSTAFYAVSAVVEMPGPAAIVSLAYEPGETSQIDAATFAGQGPYTYCTAKVNSCQTLPTLSFEGTPQASASSGFLITASNTKASKPGLLIYSDSGAAFPPVPFQGGFLCIEAPISRSIPVADTVGTPDQCDGQLRIDMNAFAAGTLGGSPQPYLVEPGTQINCQFWARDTGASLLTDALQYWIYP